MYILQSCYFNSIWNNIFREWQDKLDKCGQDRAIQMENKVNIQTSDSPLLLQLHPDNQLTKQIIIKLNVGKTQINNHQW